MMDGIHKNNLILQILLNAWKILLFRRNVSVILHFVTLKFSTPIFSWKIKKVAVNRGRSIL